MIEREGLMTREEILNVFPPQREMIKGKNGDVPYHISRKDGQIVYVVPETMWLKRGEQPENQPA